MYVIINNILIKSVFVAVRQDVACVVQPMFYLYTSQELLLSFSCVMCVSMNSVHTYIKERPYGRSPLKLYKHTILFINKYCGQHKINQICFSFRLILFNYSFVSMLAVPHLLFFVWSQYMFRSLSIVKCC